VLDHDFGRDDLTLFYFMRIMAPRRAGNENFELRGAVSGWSLFACTRARSHMIFLDKAGDVEPLPSSQK
jgi:hypothetical protein